MSTLLAMVTIPAASGIPEDCSCNTFHFVASTPPSISELAAIQSRLSSFYDGVHFPGTSPLVQFMSGTMVAPLARLRVYDLADLMPRAPIFDAPLNIVTLQPGSGLPAEVALTLSYQGIKVSGLPQARRRGRIYFGPLSAPSSAYTGGATPNVRPTQAVINALAGAGQYLASENDVLIPPGAATLKWVVRSRVGLSSVDVADGWVDNSFDSQRRRGEKATARTVWF